MSEHTYRWFSAIAGAVAGAVLRRRLRRARLPAGHQRPRAAHDLAHRPARLLPARRADRARLLDDLRAQPDHRVALRLPRLDLGRGGARCSSCSPTSRPSQGANTVYQVHAIIAWAFWALFPFSRLVHAWSIPLQYLGRPYILYRRRYATTSNRSAMSAAARQGQRRNRARARARSRSRPASTPGACSARSAPTSRTPSACRTSRPRRWSPSPSCSAR